MNYSELEIRSLVGIRYDNWMRWIDNAEVIILLLFFTKCEFGTLVDDGRLSESIEAKSLLLISGMALS